MELNPEKTFAEDLIYYLQTKSKLMEDSEELHGKPIFLKLAVDGKDVRVEIERVGKDFIAGKDVKGASHVIHLSHVADWRDVTGDELNRIEKEKIQAEAREAERLKQEQERHESEARQEAGREEGREGRREIW